MAKLQKRSMMVVILVGSQALATHPVNLSPDPALSGGTGSELHGIDQSESINTW